MIKFLIGIVLGFLTGLVLTLFSIEKYYNYREDHGPLFSGQTVEETKDSIQEAWNRSGEKIKGTYEHSKESVKDWVG